MPIYQEIDGLRYDMEQIWNSGLSDQFPKNKSNLVENYKYIEEYMNTNCHPNATLGAAVNVDGLLTDHGPDHVKMVIENAKRLVGDLSVRKLNGYEIYLLFRHLYRSGNAVSGRSGQLSHDGAASSPPVGCGDPQFRHLRHHRRSANFD